MHDFVPSVVGTSKYFHTEPFLGGIITTASVTMQLYELIGGQGNWLSKAFVLLVGL